MQCQGKIRLKHSVFLFPFKEWKDAFLTSLFSTSEVLRYPHQPFTTAGHHLPLWDKLCRSRNYLLNTDTKGHTQEDASAHSCLISPWCSRDVTNVITKAEAQLLTLPIPQPDKDKIPGEPWGGSDASWLKPLGGFVSYSLEIIAGMSMCVVCNPMSVDSCKERHPPLRSFFCVQWVFFKTTDSDIHYF